jgi:hypothetical protein
MDKQNIGEIIIYSTDDGLTKIDVKLKDETVWLTIDQMAQLFGKARSTIAEHISNVFKDKELEEKVVCRDFRQTTSHGAIADKKQNTTVRIYNLDVIISVGYRVKSVQGVHFRKWATKRLKEYIIKGYSINSDQLKELGGGNYFKELLQEIRDIRSSEKVMYRQVLDLYATSVDYDPNSQVSLDFFKIVQNKLHFAAHGNTAAEIVYFRIDSNKPFAGITNFKGSQPTQAEAMVAKNYLSLKELKILNNLVSAYFDLAEMNALEEKPMTMNDHIKELDNILNSTKRKLLSGSGKISHKQATDKAIVEYKKYKAKTLSETEKAYLRTIKKIEKHMKSNLK